MPVILASGGIDSVTLFYSLAMYPRIYGHKPTEPIYNFVVDFGQVTFERSVNLVRWHQEHLRTGRLAVARVELPKALDLNFGPMFNANAKISKNRNPVGEDYVNGRNIILITQALAFASANKTDLYLGLYDEEDGVNFETDRTARFLDAYTEMIHTGGFKEGTIPRIQVPFMVQGFKKLDVVMLAYSLDVDLKRTSSCPYVSSLYGPECGKCGICIFRKKILAQAAKLRGKKK